MNKIDLEYYMFDWDDNIMFMPTAMHRMTDLLL